MEEGFKGLTPHLTKEKHEVFVDGNLPSSLAWKL